MKGRIEMCYGPSYTIGQRNLIFIFSRVLQKIFWPGVCHPVTGHSEYEFYHYVVCNNGRATGWTHLEFGHQVTVYKWLHISMLSNKKSQKTRIVRLIKSFRWICSVFTSKHLPVIHYENISQHSPPSPPPPLYKCTRVSRCWGVLQPFITLTYILKLHKQKTWTVDPPYLASPLNCH